MATLASSQTPRSPFRAGSSRDTDRAATALSVGLVTLFLSVLVLLPIAALMWEATSEGKQSFWDAVSSPQAVAALKLTLVASLAVSVLNAVLGTIIAWVLVRDDFRGQSLVNAVIDLPFALPTIVAGVTLLALYGPTLPSTSRCVHARPSCSPDLRDPAVRRTDRAPVLARARPRGGGGRPFSRRRHLTTFRRIVFPQLLPDILLASRWHSQGGGRVRVVAIITGDLPFDTQVSSVYIFGRIESGDLAGAAAVSVVLLAISFQSLLSIGGIRHLATRHDR